MMKTTLRLHDLNVGRSRKPVVGTWLRLTRTVSAACQTMLAWPAMAFRARRDMEQLGRLSEHELRDIGLIRQDLYDLQALPLGRDPTTVLGLRVHQRKRVSRLRGTSHDGPNITPWGL